MSTSKPPAESSARAKSQIEKFRELAREVEADEDPETFKAVVRKIAKAPKAAKVDQAKPE
jgi:hypothetical protein